MATTADEHKPDIEHLKSKMIRFPEEILMANLTPLSANQSFRPGMENYEFEIGKTCLEDRVNQFQTLFDQSLTHFSRTDETDLKNQLERKFVALVRNSCSPDFLVESGRELAAEKTFEGALNFWRNYLGLKPRRKDERRLKINLKNWLGELIRTRNFRTF